MIHLAIATATIPSTSHRHHTSTNSTITPATTTTTSIARPTASPSSRHSTAAVVRTRLNALTLTDLDGGLVIDGGVAHALLDLSGHGQEGLFDVGRVLGRGLEEGNAETIGEFL